MDWPNEILKYVIKQSKICMHRDLIIRDEYHVSKLSDLRMRILQILGTGEGWKERQFTPSKDMEEKGGCLPDLRKQKRFQQFHRTGQSPKWLQLYISKCNHVTDAVNVNHLWPNLPEIFVLYNQLSHSTIPGLPHHAVHRQMCS